MVYVCSLGKQLIVYLHCSLHLFPSSEILYLHLFPAILPYSFPIHSILYAIIIPLPLPPSSLNVTCISKYCSK